MLNANKPGKYEIGLHRRYFLDPRGLRQKSFEKDSTQANNAKSTLENEK